MSKKSIFVVGRDYDNYFDQVRENYKSIDNPFWYYEKLLNDLLSIDKLDILPIKDFIKIKDNNKIVAGFRHDIDADPITAVRCARAMSRLGLSGSFYFLHTAIYYGEFYEHVFIRNPEMYRWIKDITIAGSEIGIHNDALGVFKFFKKDGLKHFKSELNWMRASGAKIVGTTAHNNAVIYHAENYEIFNDSLLYMRPLLSKEKKYLGNFSLKKLGLEYDGTFGVPKKKVDKVEIKKYFNNKDKSSVSNEDWAFNYFNNNPVNDWSVDSQFWIIGKNKWVFSGSKNNDLKFQFGISLSKVIDIVKQMKPGSKTLFVLHPEYFGGTN